MKLDSKLFDRIRIRPRNAEEPRVQVPRCAWEGCDQPGIYRAPKGNRAVGEYHNFCLEHVRHYNTAFNFFSGMSTTEMNEHLSRFSGLNGITRERGIRDDSNETGLGEWTRSPAPAASTIKPVHRDTVVLVTGPEQRNQQVGVEEVPTHRPSASIRRTSTVVTFGESTGS